MAPRGRARQATTSTCWSLALREVLVAASRRTSAHARARIQFAGGSPDRAGELPCETIPLEPAVSVDFNPFTDLNIRETSPIYRTLRDRAPVHWSPEGQIFTVSRYDDVSAVLKDSETF